MALEALVQKTTGTRLVYGFFKPEHSDTYPFGAFINRNHFAGYMLLVLPLCLALLAGPAEMLRRALRWRRNWRDRVLLLDLPEARQLLYRTPPALLVMGALLASKASRGAFVAVMVTAVLVSVRRDRRDAAPPGLRCPSS